MDTDTRYPHPLHRDEGTGLPVVLLHGFPDTAATWDAIADALVADGRRVIVPHLRGHHADTIDPGRGYGARELANDAVRVLDAAGVAQAVLVGHDWGATLGYGAASLAPQRVLGLVAVGIPHPRTITPTPQLAWKARHFLTLRVPGAAKRFAAKDLAAVDDIYRRWAPGWSGPERDACIAAVKAAFGDPDVLDAALGYYRDLSPRPEKAVAGRCAAPGLLVGGTRDLIPGAAFEAGAKGFKNRVTVEVYDGAGHWPHRERQDRFIADLRSFLATLG